MEEMATEEGEVMKARSSFRADLAKASHHAAKANDPDEIEKMANTPPHLRAR